MTEITVQVRLSGSLAERLGPRRAVTLPAGADVQTLLGALAREAGLGAEATAALAVVVDGTIVARERTVADGERLDVLVPAAGG